MLFGVRKKVSIIEINRRGFNSLALAGLSIPYFGIQSKAKENKKRKITHMSYCKKDSPNIHHMIKSPTQKDIESLINETSMIRPCIPLYFWSYMNDKERTIPIHINEICYKSSIKDRDEKLRFDNCVCCAVRSRKYPNKYQIFSAKQEDLTHIYASFSIKKPNIFESVKKTLKYKYSTEKMDYESHTWILNTESR